MLVTIKEFLQNIKNQNAASPFLPGASAISHRETEIILCHVLKVPRSYLYSHPEATVDEASAAVCYALLQRRQQGEPLAYILGNCGFWSFNLEIDNSVLVPRPETELLVKMALQYLDKRAWLNLAELGTGSGAVALALAQEGVRWHVCATDISENALAIAQKNAKKLGLSNVNFFHGDWCAALPHANPSLPSAPATKSLPAHRFHAIISNPPYVAIDDPNLQDNVKCFEPHLALFAGKDGLDAIKTITTQATRQLEHSGWLMLEHGFMQGKEVRQLMHAENFVEIVTHKDFAGHERVTVGRNAQ